MKKFILPIIFFLLIFIKILISAQPDDLFKKGLNYLKIKKYEKGIEILKKIPQSHKSFPYACINIGMAYYNMANQIDNINNYIGAKEIFIYLMNNYKLDKKFNNEVKKYLGLVLFSLGQYKDSFKYLTEYKEYLDESGFKSDFMFLYNYGRTLFFSCKYNEAKKYLFNALSINSNNPYTYFYLANSFYKLSNYKQAKKYFKMAYKKNQFIPEINLVFGMFLLKEEKNSNGKKLIIIALKDKKYFNQVNKSGQKKALVLLPYNSIFKIYDEHYSKFKAFYLTLYITYLKNKMLYNIIFSCLIILTILIILHKKKILKLKSK